MNRKILVISSLIVGLIVLSAIYVANSSPQQVIDGMRQSESTAKPPTRTPTESSSAKGEYIDYSPEALAGAQGTRLLFFHAAWCPQCRALESDIKANGVSAGVTILKVDYDSNQSLKQKYGVSLQTTIVKVDQSGELVEKFVAYDEPTLESVEAALLR